MTENELKHEVLRIAKANGWMVYHVPQATMRNGGGRGYPDLTLSRKGEVMWIELKQEHAKVTADQRRWHDTLEAVNVIRPSHVPQLGELLK